MDLPRRGTGLQKGLARKERGYGVPLTEEERRTRHGKVGVKALPVWWNGLSLSMKVLVVASSLAAIMGAVAVVGSKTYSRT